MAAPNMARPVPAAPSPGSSAARQKLTEADRKRISASLRAKFKDQKPRPERVGIRHRFSRGDEEWAILNDGAYWCFRAGPFEPGVIVTPKSGPVAGRIGVVTAIVPAWGVHTCVSVWFRNTTQHKWDPDAETMIEVRTRPGNFWPQEGLEILGHVNRPVIDSDS